MPSFSFIFLLILLFLIFFARADSDLIQKTCQMTNYYDVCIESLSSDPSSQDADVPGLAYIVIQTTVANVSAASSFISQLLKNAKDPLLKQGASTMRKIVCQCQHRSRQFSARTILPILRLCFSTRGSCNGFSPHVPRLVQEEPKTCLSQGVGSGRGRCRTQV
ncbi:hypothetical protein ACLOJK_013904 [Asimina triloba]